MSSLSKLKLRDLYDTEELVQAFEDGLCSDEEIFVISNRTFYFEIKNKESIEEKKTVVMGEGTPLECPAPLKVW